MVPARTTRRNMLATLASVAVGGVGATLAACSSSAVKGTVARPTSAAAVEEIRFQLWVTFLQGPATGNRTVQKIIQNFVDEQFNSKHRGVHAVWEPWAGNTAPVVAAIIAGDPTAPAVIASWGPTWPAVVPFLEPLAAYLKADNVNLSNYQPRQLAQVGGPGGVYAIPQDASAQVYIYNQSLLDRLGLTYPAQDWSSEEAVRLWKACVSNKGGHHRYGATVQSSENNIYGGAAWLPGFGGGLVDQTGMRCLLGEAGSIAFGEWLFPLFWDGVCPAHGGGDVTKIAQGLYGFGVGPAEWVVLYAARQFASTFKWDFLPFPQWPVRPAVTTPSEFYAINSFTPYKEVAWELLKFLAIDPIWQRFNMRLSLNPPGLVPLLEEWTKVASAAAPILETKHMNAMVDPIVRGEGYPAYPYFKYDTIQADQLIGSAWARIGARTQSVTTGLTSVSAQVDAFENTMAVQPTVSGPATAEKLVAAGRKNRARLEVMFASAGKGFDHTDG